MWAGSSVAFSTASATGDGALRAAGVMPEGRTGGPQGHPRMPAEELEEFDGHGAGLDKIVYEFGRTEAGS